MGNIISKNPIRKVQLKEDGVSTLGAVNIYYDDTVRRLNTDERGRLLGAFKGDDKILTIMQSGELKFYSFDLSSHFEEDMILLEKFKTESIITAIYLDGESKKIYAKRFSIEQPQMMRKIPFITEHPNSKLLSVTIAQRPQIELIFNAKKNKKEIPNELIDIENFTEIKSIKAKGKQLSKFEIHAIKELEPLPEITEEETEEAPNEEIELNLLEDENVSSKTTENQYFESNIEDTATPEIIDTLPPIEIKPIEIPETPTDVAKVTESEQNPENSEDEPTVKQNIDDIPFEVVTPPKKKKETNNDDGQMSLFGE
jgi:hypothetical protein